MATYAWRAGTSICEMEKRATSMAAAAAPPGMSGTASKRMLDGRCEAIIVSMAPKRRTK